MKYFTLIVLCAFLSCSSKDNTKKENELLEKENALLKKELELQKKENNVNTQKSVNTEKENTTKTLSEKAEHLTYLFSKIAESVSLDEFGHLKIDMGSASAGRYEFNINKVRFSTEERPEEPGCADICPPRLLLKFKCSSDNCISDPTISDYYQNSGVIAIYDIPLGKKIYNELKSFQKK